MMKLLAILSLLPVLSFANPAIAPWGIYTISSFEPGNERVVHMVDTRSSTWRQELENLKKAGFFCQRRPMNKFICHINRPAVLTTSELVKLNQRFFGSALTFFKVRSTELVSSAPMMTEFKVNQDYVMRLKDKEIKRYSYIYRELPEMNKIYLEGEEFIYDNGNDELTYFTQLKKNTPMRFSVKNIKVRFSREEN